VARFFSVCGVVFHVAFLPTVIYLGKMKFLVSLEIKNDVLDGLQALKREPNRACLHSPLAVSFSLD
jgi:hypothetical protein